MKTNHPANGPVSLDRLHQISEILSKASAQSDGGNLGYAMADAVKVIDGAIAAFNAEPVISRDELPLDYLQGQKDGLEWAAQLAEANHPQTGDWLYDDPIELAKAIRKGPDMPEGDGNSPATPDGWIPVSERMPEDAQWCAVNTEYGYYVQCWSEGQGWLGDEINLPSCDVTHWMPLPEPKREVKNV